MKSDFVNQTKANLQYIYETASEKYTTDDSDKSTDEIRSNVGKQCFDISQKMQELFAYIEKHFEKAFDVNNREEDVHKLNTISIYELLNHIERYESLSLLFGIDDKDKKEILTYDA